MALTRSEHTRHNKPGPVLSGEALLEWLDSLPRHPVGALGEQLFMVLQQIRTQPLPAGERLQVLESLREPVHYVTNQMKKRVGGIPSPLPDKLQRVSMACRALYRLMADAYISIKAEPACQAIAIHRAMTYINQSLLHAYTVYAAHQHDHWGKLHSLYNYAQQHALQDMRIDDNLYLSSTNSSISDEYSKALLLYLAEPYHLRPGEIEQVAVNIERWRGLVSIEASAEQPDRDTQKMAIIALDQNRPPQTSNSSLTSLNPDNSLYLNNTVLLDKLQQELDESVARQHSHEHNRHLKQISIGLLRRLIESWGQTRRQRFPRQQIAEKVNVTVGLHQTHMQLVYEHHIATSKKSRDFFDTHRSADVWTTVYTWANAQADILDYRVRQDNWSLINESNEGFCLVCADQLTEPLRVGELVSLQRRKQTNTRSIGIVCWIKSHGQSGIKAGGMLLASSANPVGLLGAANDNDDYVIDRGLLLPLMQLHNRPESLITFNRQYKSGDVLIMTQSGKENITIKLLEQVTANAVINQFVIARLNQSQTDNVNNDFADVWQDL